MKSTHTRDDDGIGPALRAAGLRCTMPRLRVASALRGQQGHLTVDAIYALVAEREPAAPMALLAESGSLASTMSWAVAPVPAATSRA